MGQIASRNRRRVFLAGAALLTLALAACSGPTPPGTSPSVPTTSSPSTAPPSSSTSAAPDVSALAAAPSVESSTSAAPGAGGLGGFGSISEACGAVSATVLSVLVLPMAAAIGKDTADVEKAKEALAKMQGQVPAELKEPFDKLKSIADDAGRDFSKFNGNDFDKAIAPIDSWLQTHC
ncbi:hypothetical protein [Arthrobacter sp. UYCu712]|uniref:hypothetical protein n=1 Tax=Arthrobacter sp. UYCu712 TaxID=3156340 RepID=UPI003394E76E